MEVPQNIKNIIPYDLAIPLLGIYLKKIKTLTCKYIIYNSQDVKTTAVPIYGWMDKKKVIIYTMVNYAAIKKNEVLPFDNVATLRVLC